MIYSQGTAEKREDGLILNPPFFGIIDGFSAPYIPREQKLFENLSGGEMVRKIVLEAFYSANDKEALEKIVSKANSKIGEFQIKEGIPLDRPDLLAGCSFVFAKIKKKKIEIIQGGDCLAVWKYKDGKIGATKNYAFEHVSRNLKIIADLMRKHKGDRRKMWVDFVPILTKMRQRDINNPKIETGFAVLNGQTNLNECWQKIEIPIKNLEIMLLFSDGLIPFPYEETVNENELAKKTIALYKKKGLDGLLQRKRKIDKKQEKKSYIAQDEATAISIKFAQTGFFIF
jgi:hypothetical protein